MTNQKTTTKLNLQVSNAESALDRLVGEDVSDAEKRELLSTVRLVLKVCEHKMLRLAELESEVAKLKTAQAFGQDPDLMALCVDLQAENERLRNQMNGEEWVSTDLQDPADEHPADAEDRTMIRSTGT